MNERTLRWLWCGFLFLGIISTLHGQQLFSSAGTTFSSAVSYLSWSIGEPVATTFSYEKSSLSQGYHQPGSLVTNYNQRVLTGEKFRIYPNPVKNLLSIKSFDEDEQGFSYRILNSMGALIIEGSTKNQLHQIDMQTFPNGFYLMKIYPATLGKSVEILKILKH